MNKEMKKRKKFGRIRSPCNLKYELRTRQEFGTVYLFACSFRKILEILRSTVTYQVNDTVSISSQRHITSTSCPTLLASFKIIIVSGLPGFSTRALSI